MVRYNLVNIGRSRFCGEVEVANEAELLYEVRKHLLSNDVAIAWKDSAETMGTVAAGFHTVGEVIKVQQ